MRIRTLAVLSMLVLPVALSAQLRRPGRNGNPLPQYPPRQIPVAAREMARLQSRWSAEQYLAISSMQLPIAANAEGRYTTYGQGTHAEYRYSPYFGATIDQTNTFYGSPAFTSTLELGGRFKGFSEYARFRPYLDLRGGYTYLFHNFATPVEATILDESWIRQTSYGPGGVGAIGGEFGLTRSWSLTSSVAVTRSHMHVYEYSGYGYGLPERSQFWTTSYRFNLGLRYNRARNLHLAQNPTR